MEIREGTQLIERGTKKQLLNMFSQNILSMFFKVACLSLILL